MCKKNIFFAKKMFFYGKKLQRPTDFRDYEQAR